MILYIIIINLCDDYFNNNNKEKRNKNKNKNKNLVY